MQPTDMIGLGLARLRGLMADTMTVPRHRDTGDSSSYYSVQEPFDEGQPLIMTEFPNAFSCHSQPRHLRQPAVADSQTSGFKDLVRLQYGKHV